MITLSRHRHALYFDDGTIEMPSRVDLETVARIFQASPEAVLEHLISRRLPFIRTPDGVFVAGDDMPAVLGALHACLLPRGPDGD
jgi:hypothetical protein